MPFKSVEPTGEEVILTQLAMTPPDNYIDGNGDWNAAVEYGVSQGLPRHCIGHMENGFIICLRDEVLEPFEVRENKAQCARAIISYIIKTAERGFVLIRDPNPHGDGPVINPFIEPSKLNP